MTRVSPRLLWWLLAVLAGGLLADLVCFPAHLAWLGVNHHRIWFLDTYALLAASDARALGHDVYRYNPLDYLGRPHVYPHAWLMLGRLSLTRADCAALGFAIGAAFFVAALARLRPRSPGELAWTLVVLCSPPVLLALERGNNDLVIFVLLAPVVPCLLARRAWVRHAPIVLIGLATWLKVYPAVAALVLLVGGETRERRGRIGAMLVVLAVLACDGWRDFAHYGPLVPRETGLMTFGAANLFTLAGAGERVGGVLALVTGALLVQWFWRTNPTAGWRIAPEQKGAWLSFVLGAAVLTGCFFAGLSYSYRWVFALWLLPLVWATGTDAAAPPRVRRLTRIIGGLLLPLLWVDGMTSAWLTRHAKELGADTVVRWAEWVFRAEQPLTWGLFGCLLVFLVRFGRDGWEEFRGRAPT